MSHWKAITQNPLQMSLFIYNWNNADLFGSDETYDIPEGGV